MNNNNNKANIRRDGANLAWKNTLALLNLEFDGYFASKKIMTGGGK
jgi:hypothetical protein